MRRGLASALLLLLASAGLAGCGEGSGEQGGGGSGLAKVTFPDLPTARRDGNEVVWRLPVANEGNGSSGKVTLSLSVRYSRTPDTPDEKSVEVAPLAAKETRTVEARTFYRGLGDYSGFAELREGRVLVGRVPVWFEECPPALLC
ncbi:MAG TPA: CARDB domain-containing protein [Candidatus Thermoplasmatota archaeon]|nr:CARDB domain-containing protein [Candidatus Thermoplasmatota archaeon]